jgi:hypothetical protein
MGVIGKWLGEKAGGFIGRKAGEKLGKYTGTHGDKGHEVGSNIGGILGGLLPFKKGGRIKKNGKIYAHKGEFILPKGVKPTTHQVKIVRRRHK